MATVSSTAASAGLPSERMEALSLEAREGLALIAAAQRVFSRAQGEQLALEAKVEFARLQLRCKGLERRGKAVAERVCARFEQLVSEVQNAALDALRLAARHDDEGYDVDKLFGQLARGGADITCDQLCDFLARVEPPMPEDRARLAFKRIAPHGLTRRKFAAALIDFRRVIRDITLTSVFEIQTASKVRKLAPGELLEATGPARTDANLALQRVPCRVVRDGATGWVTVGSAGGTAYLERAAQPMLWCSQAVTMREAMHDSSKTVQYVQPGDVLELLEGPV